MDKLLEAIDVRHTHRRQAPPAGVLPGNTPLVTADGSYISADFARQVGNVLHLPLPVVPFRPEQMSQVARYTNHIGKRPIAKRRQWDTRVENSLPASKVTPALQAVQEGALGVTAKVVYIANNVMPPTNLEERPIIRQRLSARVENTWSASRAPDTTSQEEALQNAVSAIRTAKSFFLAHK